MTHEDKGHYADKHPGEKPAPEVAEAINRKITESEISCASAFDIADKLGVNPKEVGTAADLLEKRIVKCQLGLFGHKPENSITAQSGPVPPELAKAIRHSLVEGRLPCKACWDIAERLNLPKKEVSSACESLKIKISSCQLGAF